MIDTSLLVPETTADIFIEQNCLQNKYFPSHENVNVSHINLLQPTVHLIIFKCPTSQKTYLISPLVSVPHYMVSHPTVILMVTYPEDSCILRCKAVILKMNAL
jgi:hypothetical protein